MKKILLTLFAALGLTATAQTGTYRGDLYLTIMAPFDGTETPMQQADVIIAPGETDGTVDLLLNDFRFMEAPMGDVSLTGLTLTGDGDTYTFGAKEAVRMELAGGAIVADVTLNPATSYIKGDSLVANLDIVWLQDNGDGTNSEIPIYVRVEGAALVFQFADPGFEGMDNTTPYNEWSSFESAGGSLTNFAGMSPAPSRVEGFESLYALQVHSAFAGIGIVGANANGNVTTGTVMMGNMSPTHVNNYNSSDKKMCFDGRPDAVSCDAIFISGGSPNGRGRFILHGDVNYRDPEVDNDGNVASSWETASDELRAGHIGEAAIIITPTGGAWQHFEAEFTYNQERPAQQWLLGSFTTNPTPGGSKDDYLTIDNVQFIYYHSLSALSYEGADIAFAEDVTEYDVKVADFDESKLSYTVKGVAAVATTAYDEATKTLTITVKGDNYPSDPASVTTYTVHFDVSTAIDSAPTTEAPASTAVYNLQGIKVSDTTTQGLPAGLYIQDGKKVIVK